MPKRANFWALVNLLFLGDQIEVKVSKPRSVKKMCHIILYYFAETAIFSCVILFYIILPKLQFLVQWRRHTMQGMPGQMP